MYKRVLFVVLLSLFIGACSAAAPTLKAVPTATPTSVATVPSTSTPRRTHTPEIIATAPPASTRAPTLTLVPTATPEATATSVPQAPTATPSPTELAMDVEPTLTPRPGDDERINVRDLPIGRPGNYINLTFGYQLQYPANWHTGFGSRPLLVSFSNLDPGTQNRNSMRVEGCLIEVNAAPNIFGFTLQELAAQMPGAFRNAEALELDGEPAMRVRRISEESNFDSEWVYVQHDDRLFLLTLEYARGAGDICLPAWEKVLTTWQWFEPGMAVYRNTAYGYAVTYPRRWYPFNPREEGISISSEDPTHVTDMNEFLRGAMVVETDIFENPDDLPLKEWLAAQEWDTDLANDIPVGGLLGVRVLRGGPSPGVQEMSGYFQGPLGRIYGVTCRYPEDRQWEFRPIANAIIYSFSF